MIKDRIKDGFGSHARMPLTADQFADLGRIVALFGFIERSLDIMLAHLTEIRPWPVFYLMFDGKMLGAKCDTLKSMVKMADAQDRDRKYLLKYCSDLAAIIAKRNHIVHGEWGLVGPARLQPQVERTVEMSREELVCGCHNDRNPSNPFRADQLSNFCREVDEFVGKTLDVMAVFKWLPAGENRPIVLLNARGHSSRKR